MVLAAQRDDGGWAQADDMASDAYATGQTLAIMQFTGTPSADAAFRRGVEFLLHSQREDNTWLVETRAKPVQVYFDNGDLHGKSQFISTPSSCWALVALATVAKKSEYARPPRFVGKIPAAVRDTAPPHRGLITGPSVVNGPGSFSRVSRAPPFTLALEEFPSC